MVTEVRKPSRNEVVTSVRDELEGRRLFKEHYEVSVLDVEVHAAITMSDAAGGFQAGSTVVSLRVVVSWNKGALAVDQVNDLQDHLDGHWVGSKGNSTLDHEDCKITIEGEYTWDSWSREW